MAVAVKVHRVANPHRRRRIARGPGGRFLKRKKVRRVVRKTRVKRVKRAKRNPGSKIRRYSVKSLRTELRRRGVKSAPRRRAQKSHRRVRRTASNPVLVELGMLNPHRRKRSNPKMARKKRVNRRRAHRRHRRPNPVTVVTRRRRVNRRRTHHGRRHRSYSRRRRNPMGTSTTDMMIYGVGGLIGVAATKFLPTLIPASMLSSLPSNALVSILITGAGAFAASFIAGKIAPQWAKGVLYGGLMQTASAALNAFAPASIKGALALSGVGDIIPTMPFPVPNNQMRPMLMAAPAPAGVSGVGASMRRVR